MSEALKPPYFIVGNRKCKVLSLEALEALRCERVPDYYNCPFRGEVLAKPYDFFSDDVPVYVECKHPVFSENYLECEGQCALAGKPYGRD